MLLHTLLHGGIPQIEYEQIKRLKHFAETPPPQPSKQARFDPNRSDPTLWAITGLPGWKIKMICHYLQKGGRFRTTADFKKIYCITEQDYLQVLPYMDIHPDSKTKRRYKFHFVPSKVDWK